MQARITDVVFLGNALKIVARLPSGETLSARDPDVRRHASYVRDATESFGWALADQRVLEGGAMTVRRDAWFLAPALAIVAVMLLAPMGLLLVISFWTVRSFKLQPDFTLAAWARFFVNYGGLTLYTLVIGIVTALLCVAIGLAFAYAVRFKAGRFGDALVHGHPDHAVRRLPRQDLCLEVDPRRRRPPQPGADGRSASSMSRRPGCSTTAAPSS